MTIEILPGPTGLYAVDVGYVESNSHNFVRLATFAVPSFAKVSAVNAAIAEAKRRWPERRLCWENARLIKSEEQL